MAVVTTDNQGKGEVKGSAFAGDSPLSDYALPDRKGLKANEVELTELLYKLIEKLIEQKMAAKQTTTRERGTPFTLALHSLLSQTLLLFTL